MISPASRVKAPKAEKYAVRDSVESEPEVSQVTRFTVLSEVDDNVCLYPQIAQQTHQSPDENWLNAVYSESGLTTVARQ